MITRDRDGCFGTSVVSIPNVRGTKDNATATVNVTTLPEIYFVVATIVKGFIQILRLRRIRSAVKVSLAPSVLSRYNKLVWDFSIVGLLGAWPVV